jgi:hypothetical protein
MGILPYLLFSTNLLAVRQVPAGTPLHIRLTTTVGSYASKVGAPVSALLIAPVILDGKVVLPVGSIVSGRVKMVARVGFGIRHETAALDLEFNQVTRPNSALIPISAHVAEVDNAHERVTRDGRIHGLRATDSATYRISGYVRAVLLHCELHAALAVWLIKSLAVKVPEPEIYFPAGSELTLTLSAPLLSSPSLDEHPVAPELPDREREDLQRMVAAMPDRSYASALRRSSDLTNVLLIGSHDQIAAAFTAAGWDEAGPQSFSRRVRWLRAVGDRQAFGSAPMSSLLLNGAEPDMSWEKGFNDVSKRHHIRVWKQPGTWQGQELWIGAATRDINFAYLRPGRHFTHEIATDVDLERDKIAYDLAFTSCGSILDWAQRPEVPRVTQNATGDAMTTDTGVVMVRLNDCGNPRLSTETIDEAPVPMHAGKLQRFVRREILSARSDLLRHNWYWRGYETVRYIIASARRHQRPGTVLSAVFASLRSSSFPEPEMNVAPKSVHNLAQPAPGPNITN